MRKTSPFERLIGVGLLVLVVSGCQQADQTLPFELAEGEGVMATIGPNGGTLSVPPSFSIQFPAGSLSSSTSLGVTRLITEPYPTDAGTPVPGTAYDVDVPSGTVLNAPARVQIRVDPTLLAVGDEVKLSVAVRRSDGVVVTFTGALDLTNGLLIADIDVLGDIAAVVANDAIPVATEAPPTLGGGSIPQPAPPGPSGPAPTSHGGVEFIANCSPSARQCFSSGIVRLWADAVVRERMGDYLYLLDPTVSADIDFRSFDLSGIPTEIVGSISIGGDLRARFNSLVTTYGMEEGVTTGPTTAPQPTGLQISGNVMLIDETTTSSGSVEFNEQVEFTVTGIGTSEMLVVEIEAEIEFENDVGPPTIGILTAHVRLRR